MNNVSNGNVFNASVLIVDDDQAVLESSVELLERFGYSVIACGNPKDVLQKLRENKVDVVLTDIRMPDISGIQLLEQIKDNDFNVPVILMTAYAELDVAIDAMGKGAFDFIIKPYKPELLTHSIEMAIRHKKLNS